MSEKLSSTPDMSARDAEAMTNAMLLDSPLPDIEKSDERVPEESGSDKLPEHDDGEKFPEGGDKKQPEETPAGMFVSSCIRKLYFLCS